LRPVLDAWLEGTPFLNQDAFYVIARSGFGKLFEWGERSGHLLIIDTPYGMILPRDQSQKIRAGRADVLVQRFFSSIVKKALDMEDELHRLMFDRAQKALVALGPGEMYGFEPALVAGGTPRIENLRKVDAVAHLWMLAQFGDRRVMRDIFQDARDAGLA
jgi:hypothetical protein